MIATIDLTKFTLGVLIDIVRYQIFSKNLLLDAILKHNNIGDEASFTINRKPYIGTIKEIEIIDPESAKDKFVGVIFTYEYNENNQRSPPQGGIYQSKTVKHRYTSNINEPFPKIK